MTNNFKQVKVLSSKEAIKTHLTDITGEPCSDYLFYKYIEMGLPALYRNRRWLAHVENIDEFFKAQTRISMKNVLEKVKGEDLESHD
jgi:hypothetical protein